MFDHKIFQNESFELIDERQQVFIRVTQKGVSISDFNQLLIKMPRVKVVDFISLKSALNDADGKITKIGDLKPLAEVTISKDFLEASAVVNLTNEEFREFDKKLILESILKESNDKKIIYGQDINAILSNIKASESFIVASGKKPVRGNDAVVKMYEMKLLEPELFQDGKVNHYELNLINRVNKDEWLGERIEPTKGVEGISVLGTKIPPIDGRQEALKFDPNTVRAAYDEEKDMTFLYAKRAGAVVYIKDRISVSNYLDIQGDVSFHTGNIDFDGFVDISNTVDDNFTVASDEDIQVMGLMGIGGVDLIESRHGNIYVRGGIAGMNKAVIRCSGNLYTKFAADCTIECGGIVNIGYYAMNCNIKAKEVILEAANSQIIGGYTEATARILVSELGSRAGVQTKVKVLGFDRAKIKEDYDLLDNIIEGVRTKMNRAKKELEQFSINIDEKERIKQQEKEGEYEKYKSQVDELLARKATYISYLRAKGEGEVVIKKALYQNVSITIKDDKYISSDEELLGSIIYYDDFELHKE